MLLQTFVRLSLQSRPRCGKMARVAAQNPRAGQLPADAARARQLGRFPGRLSWSWLTSAAQAAPPADGAEHWEPDLYPRTAVRVLDQAEGLASVAAARAFTRATLRCWDVPGRRSDDIVLVLSELLANALRHTDPGHGCWSVAAGLLQPCPDSGILCAVTDPGPGQPRPRPGGRLGEPGRGLQVIGALSDQWGVTSLSPAGKIVWAVLGFAQAG
jgi:anti-sigma regulatory factor (Ser/Thr protein kinase)